MLESNLDALVLRREAESVRSRDEENVSIWDRRYKTNQGVARWPFDLIVSLVMKRFGSIKDRGSIRILDYGCGGGNHMWFLTREGFDAFACDVAPSAISLTRERLEQEEGLFLSDEHFNVLEGEVLPFSSGHFSAIVDRESLCQSSWSEIQSRVSEFRRVLAPGGWYLGVNFSCNHPDARHGEYLGQGDWHQFKHGLFAGQGRRHLFSVNEIVELFSDWHLESIVEHRLDTIYSSGRTEPVYTSEFVIVAKRPAARKE